MDTNNDEHEEVRDDTEQDADDVSFEPEDGEGHEESLQAKLKILREKLKEVQAERMEYLSGWQRSKADYVNLKKESEDRFKAGVAYGRTEALESILPALDSFDMAMANKDAWEAVDARWRTGIEYIRTQLLTSLAEAGIEPLGDTGQPFDPNVHESIGTVSAETPDQEGTIHTVVQKGYRLGARVIRPARVKVYTEEQ